MRSFSHRMKQGESMFDQARLVRSILAVRRKATLVFGAALGVMAFGAAACGGGGSTTSSQAVAITTQPASQTVATGQTATFKVVATGSAPITYQWQKNGAAISGATSASYTTPATTSADRGSIY